MTGTLEADVVIVGAGSAGCVLANRLSAKRNLEITVLEAGGADDHPWIRVPVGYARTIADPRVNWCYRSEPVRTLDGRVIDYPLGRTLGGSSAINGLVWVHGHASDYAHWEQVAGEDWGWPAMQSALHSLEAASEQIVGNRGRAGPQPVSSADTSHPLAQATLAAAARAGLVSDSDYNSGQPDGIGPVQVIVKRGQRVSAAHAFLHPARDRPNLRVLTGARAHRVTLHESRAVGVEAVTASGSLKIRARRAVVLAAGAIHTPQILMLSGIGPPTPLQALGIGVHVAGPEVGQQLQDHLQLRCVYQLRHGNTLNQLFHSRWKQAWAGAQYAVARRGWLAGGALRLVAFVRSELAVDAPDLQLFFALLSTDRLGEPPHPFPGISFSVVPLRSHARGQVTLASADPEAPPRIELPLLGHADDLRRLSDGVAWVRRIVAETPLADAIVREIQPGPGVADRKMDDGLAAFARAQATTIYHPVGTCRMGRDPNSVVDPRLRVRGVTGLRVVDASVMPRIVSGNTNAATMAIAERAATMLLADLQTEGSLS